MNILNFIAMFFLFACTQKSEVLMQPEMSIISPVGHRLISIDENEWKVGPLGKQTLSKGFRVELTLPILEQDHIQEIFKKHSMDSWIIKVRQRSSYSNHSVGYIYLPLMAPGYGRGVGLRIKQLKSGIFSINYAAAAISTRLAKMNCPALKHEYRLMDLKVIKESPSGEKIYVSNSQAKRMEENVERFNYRIVLNGGESLQGEYSFDLAAYNSQTKMRLSNWVGLAGIASVGIEKKIPVKGCTNSEVPTFNPKSDNSANKFKFGQ